MGILLIALGACWAAIGLLNIVASATMSGTVVASIGPMLANSPAFVQQVIGMGILINSCLFILPGFALVAVGSTLRQRAKATVVRDVQRGPCRKCGELIALSATTCRFCGFAGSYGV